MNPILSCSLKTVKRAYKLFPVKKWDVRKVLEMSLDQVKKNKSDFLKAKTDTNKQSAEQFYIDFTEY